MTKVPRFSRRRCSGGTGAALAMFGTLASVGATHPAAAAPTFTNVCGGLGVSLPTLATLNHNADPTLGPVLTALNGTIDGVNTGIGAPLSGKQIPVALVDPATNTYTNSTTTQCNLAVNGFAVDNPSGIAVGGGQLSGLGGTGAAAAVAGAPSAIALGNGAATASGATNALALGSGAAVSASNGVALGAGSVASRGAVPAYDALGLIGTQSSTGEVSVGATGALRQVTNLAAGTAATDAVTVGQLRGVSGTLGAATAATLGGGSVYNPLLGTVTLPSFNIRGTAYANVGAALDAVDVALGTGGTNGTPAPFVGNNSAAAAAPVATGQNATAGGYGASATGNNSVALGAGSTDGGQSNVVSVGGVGAERRIINVAPGQVAPGSTDVVNGGQLFDTNTQVASLQHGAVQYDRAADGSTLASVTLGSDAGGPVVIHNLAAGVAASDAATVGQVQAVASTSVQYTTVNGVKTNTVTLQGGSPGGVTLANVAPGQQGTDAVNLNQLKSYSGSALGQADAYTDARISNLKAFTTREIASARRDAAGGTALALAATGLRYDDRPGKISVGGATAYYNGQAGIAFGVAATSETGRVRVNAAISASPTIDHPDVGGVIGASIAIN